MQRRPLRQILLGVNSMAVRQVEWVEQNGSFSRSGVLAPTTLASSKFSWGIRTAIHS